MHWLQRLVTKFISNEKKFVDMKTFQYPFHLLKTHTDKMNVNYETKGVKN